MTESNLQQLHVLVAISVFTVLWLFWRTRTRPKPTVQTEKQKSTSSDQQATAATYRVREIPKSFSRDVLHAVLVEVLQLGEGNGLSIVSLATDATKPHTQHATIEFKKLPAQLSGKQPWEISLPDTSNTILLIDTDFMGITTLYSPPEDVHQVDIIALSGLAGHAFGSFKQKGSNYMWLRDSLPKDLPQARILTYGYDTHLVNSQSFQDLEALGRSFNVALRGIKRDAKRLIPKIFIGHSLGGLVIKQAFIQMKSWKGSNSDMLFETYSILFFGVPNRGMNIEALIPMVEGQPNQLFLLSLSTESQLLREQCERFKHAFDFSDSEVTCFYETERTSTAMQGPDGKWRRGGPPTILVGSDSARHARDWELDHSVLPINKNHSDMVKFSRSDETYQAVLATLGPMIQKSSVMTITRAPPPEAVASLREFRQWLSPPDPKTNHEHAYSLRKEGTGAWFLEGEAFIQWKTSAGSFLWLSGKPGCGKTVLSSAIIEDVVEHLKWDRSSTVVRYYFDFTDKKKQVLSGFLRSLLVQLLSRQPEAMEPAKKLYDSAKFGSGDPSLIDLQKTVSQVVAYLDQVYIILDALDECKEQGELLGWLLEMFQEHRKKLHIIAASRREDLITKYMEEAATEIPIRNEDVDADIVAYIKEQLKTPQLRYLPPSVRDEILTTLSIKSNGMFRWTFCQIQVLQDCLTPAELRAALNSLPETLDETYLQALRRIPDRFRSSAARVFKWLIYSLDPLSIGQVAEILTTLPAQNEQVHVDNRLFNARDILRYCGTLANVQQLRQTSQDSIAAVEDESELRLSHFSVQEYLTSDKIRTDFPEFHVDRKSANADIAGTSLNYLSFISQQEVEPEDAQSQYTLLHYTALYWQSHMVRASDAGNLYDLNGRVASLLSDKGFLLLCLRVRPWESYADRLEVVQTDPDALCSSLYYACYLGLLGSARILLERNTVADLSTVYEDSIYKTVLQAAAASGSRPLVELLLMKGADPNQIAGEYGNALQVASLWGFKDISEVLLRYGASPNLECGRYGNPLKAAAYNGRKDIVELLLDAGAEIHCSSGRYGSALLAAIEGENSEIVALLLRRGADATGHSQQHENPLPAAARKGNIDIIKLLLSAGADVDAEGAELGNALQASVWSGNQDIVKLLIDNGAKIDQESGELGNALQAAARRGDIAMTELLLKCGATVDALGGYYGHALQASAADGGYEVMNILLKAGADPNAEGGVYNCALQAAAFNGDNTIAQLLLDSGASPLLEGGRYGTALQAAAHGQHLSTVKLLLNAKSNVNAICGQYGTALQAGAGTGDIEIVDALLEAGADVMLTGGDHGTPLQAAAFSGSAEVVQRLLKSGADKGINTVGGKYGSALRAASLLGEEDVVKILLQWGADVNLETEQGSALGAAIGRGHFEIAELLREAGAVGEDVDETMELVDLPDDASFGSMGVHI